MVCTLQKYKHHLLKGHKANCSILPFRQLKHLVLYGSGCPKAASGVTVMRRGCCLVNLLPTLAATKWKYSKQNPGWKYGTYLKTATWMSSWLEKKQRNLGFTLCIILWLASAADFVFQKRVRDANVVECIYSDIFGTKKTCPPLWGRKRIFCWGLSILFQHLCLYLADWFSYYHPGFQRHQNKI